MGKEQIIQIIMNTNGGLIALTDQGRILQSDTALYTGNVSWHEISVPVGVAPDNAINLKNDV